MYLRLTFRRTGDGLFEALLGVGGVAQGGGWDVAGGVGGWREVWGGVRKDAGGGEGEYQGG